MRNIPVFGMVKKNKKENGKEETGMVIIVGLGNPGKEYEHTRHNVGFDVIDLLAETYGIHVTEKKHKALIGKGVLEGRKVVLAKPQTYMNLSGESVRALIDYYKADERSELLVIYDDISLDVGKLRIRKKGSAGGHNGIKNILAHLGHDEFTRIKIGVGGKTGDGDLIDHVLGRFRAEDQKTMTESMICARDAVVSILCDGADQAMNLFNGKK